MSCFRALVIVVLATGCGAQDPQPQADQKPTRTSVYDVTEDPVLLEEARVWGNVYDQVIERSGAELTLGRGKDGEVRQISLPHGVTISQNRVGDRLLTTTVDKSGLGAVSCFWKIYQKVSFGYKACDAFIDARGAERTEDALDRIAGFMAENSFGLTTLDELNAGRTSQTRKSLAKAGLKSGERATCTSEGLLQFVGHYEAMDDATFDAEIDKLLSLPRFPADNPCL